MFERQRTWKIIAMVFLFFGGFSLIFAGVAGFDSSMGGNTVFQDSQTAVIEVGDSKVSASDFLNFFNQEINRRTQNGVAPTASELVTDGTVEQILEGLTSQALFADAAQETILRPDKEYLVERLKRDPNFQDEQGNFQAAYFNNWVESSNRAGRDWDSVYSSFAEVANNEIRGSLLLAGARASEKEVREQFELASTKIKVKFTSIEPAVEITEVQIQLQHESNLARYMTPVARTIEFVALSLQAPDPPLVQDLIDRARAGEDFAALATENSEGPTSNAANGGDLGWIGESDETPDYQLIIFPMNVGEVSDPVHEAGSIHIYKVEEERDRDDGTREIHAREIVLQPQLSVVDRDVVIARAGAFHANALKAREIRSVAESEGLLVHEAVDVSAETESILGVNELDTFTFRQAISTIAFDGISDVIQGPQGAYIVKVTAVKDSVQMGLEEARERVEQDAIAAYKREAEYITQVTDITTKISESAKSLADIQTQFPELAVEIKEAGPFGPTDFLFGEGIFWQTRDAIALLDGKEPGEMAGPLPDFQQVVHFIELVERVPPTDEDWNLRWPEEKEVLMARALQFRRSEREQDYLQFLRQNAQREGRIVQDIDAIYKLIGLGGSEEFQNELMERTKSLGLAPGSTPTESLPFDINEILSDDAEGDESAVDEPVVEEEAETPEESSDEQ